MERLSRPVVIIAAFAASLAVGLETGPSYVQVRMRDGQPWAIEVGARLGGGKDAELAKLVTGFDAIRANVLWALGELTRDDLAHGEPVAPVGQVRFVVREPGHIVRLDTAPALALDGVHEAGWYWREGMTLPIASPPYVRSNAPIATDCEPRPLRNQKSGWAGFAGNSDGLTPVR